MYFLVHKPFLYIYMYTYVFCIVFYYIAEAAATVGGKAYYFSILKVRSESEGKEKVCDLITPFFHVICQGLSVL